MTIITLKKTGFVIYYDTVLKYPILVIEKFNNKLQDCGINREKIGEPFKPDPNLAKDISFSKKDYLTYMKYGGSYGHNAPAGFHKDSLKNYKSTFLFSNISPQEVVFNSGLWVLLESFCKKLINKYKHVIVLTGNIKGYTKSFDNIKINIPTYMFKIIFVFHKGNVYNVNFIMKNKPYYKKLNIGKHKTTIDHIRKLQLKMGFDINMVINKIVNGKKIYNLTKIEPVKIDIDNKLEKQMKASSLYGKFIYAKDYSSLQKIYKKERDNMGHYHKIYYKLAKNKLSQ